MLNSRAEKTTPSDSIRRAGLLSKKLNKMPPLFSSCFNESTLQKDSSARHVQHSRIGIERGQFHKRRCSVKKKKRVSRNARRRPIKPRGLCWRITRLRRAQIFSFRASRAARNAPPVKSKRKENEAGGDAITRARSIARGRPQQHATGSSRSARHRDEQSAT